MYRVIITNPEMLLRPGKTGFIALFKNPEFTARLLDIVIDEAHCVSQWGSFRPEYKELRRLKHFVRGIKFHITSATLPKPVLTDVLRILNISPEQVHTVHRSNDRSNVAIVVRKIKYSLSSFADLFFLVDKWAAGGTPPPKFLILFDSILECTTAALVLRGRLPLKDRNKIKWHHSDMSAQFRVEVLEALLRGEIIGMCATDTLGMVCV